MGKDVRSISISVDPTVYSPARLQEYARRFNFRKGWYFLTGCEYLIRPSAYALLNNMQVRQITGLSGVTIGVAGILLIPLYFMYSGPPPAWNVLTRDLLNLILCAFLIVFMAGFRHLIRTADATYDWIASLVFGAGLIFVTVTLVAISLEAGVVFGALDGTLDPTIDGPLANGNILIHGSIKRVLTIVILVPAGFAVLRTRMLPRWIGRAAYGIALFNLAFVPSIYFGKDAAQFYSAVGWGNSAFAASFLVYWILAVGIAMLRQRGNEPTQVIGKIQSQRLR